MQIRERDMSLLQCPATKQNLVVVSDSEIKSLDGRAAYSVRDGVPNFLSSAIWATPGNDRLPRLLDVAKKNGYRAALDTVVEDPHYVTDTARASYLDLLPLRADSTVLEIGASLGQHTHLIARRVKHVEALEVVPEQALFTNLRCTEEGLSVGTNAGGDDCKLPFKDSVFDVVIMNYVLEWAAGRSGRDPKAAHELLIKECNRVLKPGGVLFLSTKNRFNLRMLMGAFDEHVGFRFGNALPRWLMKLLAGVVPYSLSRGYLHSYGALHRIVTDAGFSAIEAKLVVPDARYPLAYSGFTEQDIASLRANDKVMSADRRTRFLLTKIPNGAIKWFAPSFVFIATK